MSISQALNTAGSGLTAAARAIQVAAGNVANAATPGYAPRQLQQAAAALGGQGGGVRILGIARQADPVLQGLLRTASAAVSDSAARAGFWAAVQEAAGLPDAAGGLSDLLDRFSGALVAAADRPDQTQRLVALGQAGRSLAAGFGTAERAIQDQRLQADQAIARDVGALNAGLGRLHGLNEDIARLTAIGQPALELQESREALLLDLSQIVPMKAYLRPEGRMVVYSETGALLLDLKPASFDFSAVPALGAGQSLANGDLSGLTLNGRPVATGDGGPVAGGRLAAAFAIRDRDAPAAQAALDDLARSLVSRLQDPAGDPSLGPGQPGLLTDAGAALAGGPAPPGLAGRLALNPLADPAQGGELWRLRDGLGAAVPGPVGENGQLLRWISAHDRPLAPGPGQPARAFGQDLAELLGAFGGERQQVDDRLLYTSAVQDGLRQRQAEAGVDIDAEMRRLMEIETAYAANARVMQIADDMLRRLMEI